MSEMYTPEREQAIEELRKVCIEIGCSGLDPKMCKEQPHLCAIIRRLFALAAGGSG